MAIGSPRAEHTLRLAELLAAVSLASDLAHDVPAESALRDALLAVAFARLIGWTEVEASDVFYLALLYHIGCTGAVAAQSRLGAGDDINVRRWMSDVDYANRPEMMRIAVTKVAPHWGAAGWVQGVAALATAGRDLPEVYAGIAEVASRLSQRLGASSAVTDSLCHAYGRWDGKIFPALPKGEGLSKAGRLVHRGGGGAFAANVLSGLAWSQTNEGDDPRAHKRETDDHQAAGDDQDRDPCAVHWYPAGDRARRRVADHAQQARRDDGERREDERKGSR